MLKKALNLEIKNDMDESNDPNHLLNNDNNKAIQLTVTVLLRTAEEG